MYSNNARSLYSCVKINRLAVELNIVDHCNLRCENCDHSSSIVEKKFVSIDEVKRDLFEICKVLHVKELKILGGEPLLHPQIKRIIEVAKESGIADRIVLLTNGILLEKLTPYILELIDGIWISIYPNINYKFNDEYLKKFASDYNIWIWKKITNKFVKILLNDRNCDKELVQFIYDLCFDAHTYSCHTIRNGYYYKCAPSAYMKDRLMKKGIVLENENDKVSIHNNHNLKNDLETFINSKTPLEACSYCLGGIGKFHPHRQMNDDDLVNVLKEDHSDVIRMINEDYILQWR